MTTETYAVNVTSGKASIKTDPNASLDYGIDWTDWLDLINDSLDSFEADIDEGDCEIDTSKGDNGLETRDGKITVAWVKGGTPGTVSRLRFRVTTVGGAAGPRTDDRSVYLRIKER